MKEVIVLIVLIAVSVCLVTSSDVDPGDINRPCGTSIDLDCVKQYLSEHSDCKVVEGDNRPSERYNLTQNLYATVIGVTLFRKNLIPSYTDGHVEEFYIDSATGNLVLSLNLANITSLSPETYYVYNQLETEPLVVRDLANTALRAVVTAVIPASDGITPEALKNAQYSTYYSEGDCIIELGEKTLNSDEPRVQEALKGLDQHKETVIIESLHTAGPYYYLEHLQHHICDFNIKPNLPNTALYRDISAPIKNIAHNRNGDETDKYEPCDGEGDIRECAADFFSGESHCARVDSPGDEPVTRRELVVHMPMYNSSVTKVGAKLSGLNGKIRQLYINKVTNNLVCAIHFDEITLESPQSPLVLYQRSSQPKLFEDSTIDHYYNMTLTAIIPMNDGLSSEAIQKAYVAPHLESIIILPENGYSTDDPQITSILESLQDETNILTCAKEILNTEGYSMFLAYLQTHICDYDLSISDSSGD